MIIEAGKYYRTRDGRRAGPVEQNDEPDWPWIGLVDDNYRVWSKTGNYSYGSHKRDLIAPWTDETPATVTTDLASQPTRLAILDAAKAAVSQRAEQYGGPEDSFRCIARYWNAYLHEIGIGPERMLNPTDVAILMGLMKAARLTKNPKHADSALDACGYFACAAEVSGAT